MVGMSTKAVYRAIARGEIQAAKVANGTRLLIPSTAAEAWLETNVVVPRKTELHRWSRRRGDARPLSNALSRLATQDERD